MSKHGVRDVTPESAEPDDVEAAISEVHSAAGPTEEESGALVLLDPEGKSSAKHNRIERRQREADAQIESQPGRRPCEIGATLESESAPSQDWARPVDASEREREKKRDEDDFAFDEAKHSSVLLAERAHYVIPLDIWPEAERWGADHEREGLERPVERIEARDPDVRQSFSYP